jgi:hypothetical protein
MRLGTRWPFGTEPPAAVPSEIRAAIGEAEVAVGDAATGGAWTLTWLEGRPIAALDDGTTVTLEAGVARIGHESDAEDPDGW